MAPHIHNFRIHKGRWNGSSVDMEAHLYWKKLVVVYEHSMFTHKQISLHSVRLIFQYAS